MRAAVSRTRRGARGCRDVMRSAVDGRRTGCDTPGMRRTAFVLVALAMGLASSARAFPAYDRELTERPPWRILLDGGVSIPINLSLSGGGYQVGGGLGLGFEFPQSDSYSFIVRAEYDHASQDR